jgi:acyl-CoA synthetase (AMP-forming)/AMP-acid ligase II
MGGLIDALLQADASRRLFARRGGWVTAGDIREMAARAAARMARSEGSVFLHASRASCFVAGLLAGAASAKRIVLPAHTQPGYLAEIGCAGAALFNDSAVEECDEPRYDLRGAERDPLLVFFTSGSTGAPKPVEKNLSRLEVETRALDALWGREAGHVLATVSHQHIYGLLFRVTWPLLSGRSADDEAAVYWEDLEERIDHAATLVSSPAHLTRLPPRPDFFARAPRLIFSSGQLLTADAAQACLQAFGKPVTEVLGATETGGIAWRRQIEPDTPWTPFPKIQLMESAEGALVVRSPYLQAAAPHETGDGVELLPDGRFRLKPRSDRIAKIDGRRISLARVEEMLAALPEIERAVALTLPQRQDALGSVVVLTEKGQALLQKLGAFRLSRHLRSAAAAWLEPAERPKHWRFVDAIPTDSQGKRILSTLRSLFDKSDPLDALVLDVRVKTDFEAEVAFTLPPELIFFAGHFPERPILPGVAQAHIAVLIAERLWGVWPSDANLARLKFRRVLSPRDDVVLKLRHDPSIGRVAFSYRLGENEVAHGEIGGFKR